MITNPYLHAVIVFALCLALAVLAGATLLQIVQGHDPSRDIGMAMISLLVLLQGYVQTDRAITTLKNGNS